MSEPSDQPAYLRECKRLASLGDSQVDLVGAFWFSTGPDYPYLPELYGVLRRYVGPLGFRSCGEYGDLVIMYPKPYSIYLRGTVGFRVQ